MCRFSGTELQARQNSIEKQTEINLGGHFLNWLELKSVRAALNFTWHLLHKYCPSLHLGDLTSLEKSLEGKQLAILAFYAGAQNATAGQIWRPISNRCAIPNCRQLNGHVATVDKRNWWSTSDMRVFTFNQATVVYTSGVLTNRYPEPKQLPFGLAA